MRLTTVTWNIGGGKHLKDGEDPSLMASYSVDAIHEIAKWLNVVDPDIVALQEAQGDKNINQVEEIAKILGYEYHLFDATSSSHIDSDKTLGNGILSKHPITNHSAGRFLNPNISTTIQGRPATSHDKGYSACDVTVNNLIIRAITLHLLPFRAFEIELDSDAGKAILQSIESALSLTSPNILIQGDFNIDSSQLEKVFPTLFTNGLDEVPLSEATTPSGKRYDHVLYRGISLENMQIDSSVKADHYPVVCKFSII